VAVELAIALPLLLLIMAGVLDLGMLFWEQQVLTNASREGARAAARAVTASPGATNFGQADRTVSQIRTVVQNYLDNYNVKDSSGNNVTLTTGVNFFYTWNLAATPAPQLTVELRNIPMKLMLLPDIGPMFPGTPLSNVINLNAQTTLAAEWTSAPSP